MNRLQKKSLSGAVACFALVAFLVMGCGVSAIVFATQPAIAQDEARPLAPPPGGPQGLRGDDRGGLWAPEAEVLITFVVFLAVIMGVYVYLRSMPTEDKPKRRR